MKLFAVFILFSLTALTNAVAIRPIPDSPPTPEAPHVPTTKLPPIDLGAIIDDIFANILKTLKLPVHEVEDRGSDSGTKDHGILPRGEVEGETILERDVIPDSIERRESLWERGLAAIQRRLTAEQATNVLCFSTSIDNFLKAKKAKNPSNLIWDDDGCGNSADTPGGFNFLPSCQRLDFGYRNFKAQGRFTSANKSWIDNRFKSDLYRECGTNAADNMSACKKLADTYYLAARVDKL